MEMLYQNKIVFLQEKPKKLFLVAMLILITFLISFILLEKIEIYDHYVTRGYVECTDTCKVIVVVPTQIDIQKIKYNNKNYEPQILSKNIEVDEKEVVSYYVYTLENTLNFKDKEIVELNFCYNKQRVIKKFINKIFKEGM